MAFWKKHRPLLAALLCLALAAGFYGGYRAVSRALRAQRIAPEFRGEAEYACAQATAFLTAGNTLSEESIYTFRKKLEAEYVAASLEAPEGGTLYKDAWCCEATVTAQGEKGNASVRALGVGGDFFFFHPVLLRSGSTIAETDFAKDTVVLDRELAWRLFGSIDVAGMPITIGGQPFVVSGVILRDGDVFSSDARAAQYGEEVAGLYLNWQALQALGETTPVAYELVGASPIRRFLTNQLEGGFSGAAVVDNTGRYSPLRLWEVLKGLPRLAMRTDGRVYPLWENAARASEVWAAFLVWGAVLCLVFPAVFVLDTLRRGIKGGLGKLREGIPLLLDRISEKRWERNKKRKGRS